MTQLLKPDSFWGNGEWQLFEWLIYHDWEFDLYVCEVYLHICLYMEISSLFVPFTGLDWFPLMTQVWNDLMGLKWEANLAIWMDDILWLKAEQATTKYLKDTI